MEKPVSWIIPHHPRPDYPLFVFLPGMDGSGKLYHRQIKNLVPYFDLHCLTISPQYLGDWEELSDRVIVLLEQELKRQSRKVYLCGESFGGCLALKIATKAPKLMEKLILVNPASSFNQRPLLSWGIGITQMMPDFLHRSSALTMLPFLAALGRIAPEDRRSLLKAMQYVPPTTISWRLSMLQQFQVSTKELQRLQFSVLVVASQGDRLLPSVAEAKRLIQQLPKAKLTILPDSGHACLLETDIHLKDILHHHACLPQSLPAKTH
jgi:pimeloyl-ACP methyl ester carboxylesterase